MCGHSAARAKGFIDERNPLQPGYYVALVFFDSATLTDRASLERPWVLATGAPTAAVRGAIVFDENETTALDPGRHWRRAFLAGSGLR